MMPLECARCIDVHGRPGCPALLENLDGKPLCCWCADGVSCPIEQRRLRAAKKKSGGEPPPDANEGNSEKAANEPESEEKMPELRENSTETAPKLCKRPGCEMKLSIGNSSGLCRCHSRWKAHAGNGHATAPTNGHAHAHAPGNGHAKADTPANGVLEDRLDKLILSFPVSDKAKIVDSWIKGVI